MLDFWGGLGGAASQATQSGIFEMKTYKNLYPRIYSFGNLFMAFAAAREGKRSRAAVADFEFDLEAMVYGANAFTCPSSADRAA